MFTAVVWRASPNETNSQRQQSGSKFSTHVQATLRLGRAGKHSGKSRRLPPGSASPTASASAREVFRSRVGKGRPAGSIELWVSPSPSKIPYGGFPQYGFKWTVSSDLRRNPGLERRPHPPHDSILYATAVVAPRN